MGGRFTNTTQNDNLTTLVNGLQEIIKNPHYKWNNQTPTLTTYFNQNTEMSTLDQGSKLQYSAMGENSPTYYNKIENFYVYGIERVQLQIDNGEFGAESSSIEGEAIILPNTITPYPGDYFKINYIKEDMLFRVTSVTTDTLEDGANIYKISYNVDSSQSHDSDLNIKDSYNMILNNVGTKFNPIIRSEKYNLIEKLDSLNVSLKKYYKALFFSERVQTFIFLHNGLHFYDPAIIEFIMRNDLFSGDDCFVYITHQLPLQQTFILSYEKTFLHCLEESDFEFIDRYRYNAVGRCITSDTTIFATRVEDYYEVDFNYNLVESQMFGILPCFDSEFINHLKNKTLFDNDDDKCIYNTIIKFVHGMDISQGDLDDLIHMDYNNNITLFYAIPCIIYCIEYYEKQLVMNEEK